MYMVKDSYSQFEHSDDMVDGNNTVWDYIEEEAKKNFYQCSAIKSRKEFLEKFQKEKNTSSSFTLQEDLVKKILINKPDAFYCVIKNICKNNFSIYPSKENNYGLRSAHPDFLLPFGASFFYDGKIELVVFEEYHKLFENIDWDYIENERNKIDAILNTANKMSITCGLVEITDLFEQFKTWYGSLNSSDSKDKFKKKLYDIFDFRHASCNFAMFYPSEENEDDIIVDFSIFQSFGLVDEETLKDHKLVEGNQEKFSEYLDYLFDRHQEISFELLPEQLKEQDFYEYCFGLDEVKFLYDFFDNRVPEDQDKSNYAQNVVADFISTFQRYNDTDSNKQLFIDGWQFNFSEEEFSEFNKRFIDAINAIPRFENYGRAKKDISK